MTKGYCDKCKARREILNPLEDVLKNGRRSVRGTCTACGGDMFKMLKIPATVPAIEAPELRAMAS